MSEVTHQDICGVHEGGQCNCDWSAENQHSPKPTHVTVPVEDIKRLEAIEKSARRLAYIVRKSVNAGPISNDPTAEGQAWRELRAALGEETPSTN